MNISVIKDCYGCGVCAISCPKHIIEIRLNKDGFYEPHITDSILCIDCSICTDVCSFLHNELVVKNVPQKSYAAWSKESAIHRKCSSGGIGFEIGRTLISEGYKVCGVRYNVEKRQAEHYIASTVEELVQSIGSKYIQSYTADGFKAINRKEKYLVVGTPCQIDSFRRYVRKFKIEDNFILMDFFCHAVPSKLMWDKYIGNIEKITGKITYASWRNKFTGWHDSYNILISGKKGYWNSRLSQGDIFFRLFFGDYCSNSACSKNCKFKYDKSSADIRIGDLWGKTYADDEKGVSAAIAFTEKGERVICETNCILKEYPFDTVAEGQMKKNIGPAYTSGIVRMMLRSQRQNIPNIFWKIIFILERVIRIPERIKKMFR